MADREFIEAVAQQVASGIDAALDRWMAEFESILQDPCLTAFDRLQAVNEIVLRYREFTGRTELRNCVN
jgi:hypothetical protein